MTPTFIDPLVGKRMGRFELVHVESGAVLASHVEAAMDGKARRRVLRGRASLPDDVALILAPSRTLRTFFSRTPVDAVFVARDGTVLKVARAVKPWRVTGSLESFAVIVSAPGFIDHSGTTPGDRFAIREAQAPRPVREILPDWAVRDVASSEETDVDPWDLGEELPGRTAGGKPMESGAGPPPRLPHRQAGRAAASRDRRADSADLERILARRTPVTWFEAVAVVRELCDEVIAASPRDDLRVPELADILLTLDGRVELAAEGPSASVPVGRAARVLLTLLGEAQTLPVQLRLLALEEVSPTPKIGLLAAFASRLEFFERPGRREHVRALYQRFQQLPETEAEVKAPLPQPMAPPSAAPWWSRRRVRAGLGVAAVVLLAGVLLWLWPGSGPPGTIEQRGPVARAVAAATRKVAEVTSDSIQAVARWLGLAATDRPTASAPAEPTADSPAADAAGPRRSRPRASQPRPVPGQADAASSAAPAGVDVTIHSIDDSDVIPPQFDQSRLPRNPPIGVSQAEIPQVDAVISATGEVESVRLVTEPVYVPAAMMLSAVKNWHFRPAMRNGLPVRYRMRLKLTNQ